MTTRPIAKILRHQIQEWRMSAGMAASGAEALEILRAAAMAGDPYDLALLDLQMPDLDGLSLARPINSDQTIAGTRIIVLTFLGQSLSTAEVKETGIDAYLVKPVQQSRLFDCLINLMKKGSDESAGALSAGPVSVRAPISSALNPEAEKVRVLLAEDNFVNQQVALSQLRKLYYTANAVANGLEVMPALEQISYGLILMDCHMPEMDGYEATRAIRRREQSMQQPCPWTSPIYIIAMTANSMHETAKSVSLPGWTTI